MVAALTNEEVRDAPSTHGDNARADMEKLGTPKGLTVIPGAPHGFVGKQSFFGACMTACEKFFAPHLKRQEHR
jgi:hypothetical protein